MTEDALEFNALGERAIKIVRRFNHPQQRVFDAMTQPDWVKRWSFGPDEWFLPVCDMELKPGGVMRYVWQHHTKGTVMGLSGTFREIVPPRRIIHTELFDEDWTGGEVVVETELAEQGEKTVMTMMIYYSSTQARDAVLKSGMKEGMALSYRRLEEILT